MDNPVIYYYRIAGITYRISLPRKYAYSHHAMLTAYQTAPCEADRFLDLSVADTLSVPDTKPIYTDGQRSVYPNGSDYVIFDGGNPPYLRIDQQGNHTHATILRSNIPYGITVSLVMWVMTLPRDLIHRGGFLLHASYIDWNGKAILFTAPPARANPPKPTSGANTGEAVFSTVTGQRSWSRSKAFSPMVSPSAAAPVSTKM